jgi:4-hydroxybenzoate polyprenyltransferase
VALIATLGGLVRACHPEPTLAVTAGAAMLAVAMHRDLRGVAAVTVTVLASQLAAGWHNDWVDADRDAATGRRDKPIPAGTIDRRSVAVAATGAALVTVGLSLLSGPAGTLVATVGLASALAYNWPLKASALSVLPYAVSFAGLPVFVLIGRPGAGPPPAWLVSAGALLGAGAHFANALPDLEADRRTGVRGLPHRIGATASAMLAALLLVTASLLIVTGPAGPPTAVAIIGGLAAGAVLVAGGYAGLRGRAGSRLVFRAAMVAALLDVALLLAAGPRL